MQRMRNANTRDDGIPALLTVAECAARLRLSPSAVYRAVERGDLEAVQIRPGGALRIPVGELARILEPIHVSDRPAGSRASAGLVAPIPKEDT